MANKSIYSAVVFFSTGEVKKWTYIDKLQYFANFLDKKHPSWIYFNVYERKSRNYLKRFYKGNIIPNTL